MGGVDVPADADADSGDLTAESGHVRTKRLDEPRHGRDHRIDGVTIEQRFARRAYVGEQIDRDAHDVATGELDADDELALRDHAQRHHRPSKARVRRCRWTWCFGVQRRRWTWTFGVRRRRRT